MPEDPPILTAAQIQPIDNLTTGSTHSSNPKNNDAALRKVEDNVKVKGSIIDKPTSRIISKEA